MTHLDRLISYDLQRDILAHLCPSQLVVIALRWDGMTNVEIARELGITKAAVSMRLTAARRSLLEQLPDLEPVVRDRSCHRRGGKRRLPATGVGSGAEDGPPSAPIQNRKSKIENGAAHDCPTV